MAPYPTWVKSMFALWVGLSAMLAVALILARPAADVKGTIRPALPDNVNATKLKDLWLVIDGIEFFAAKDRAQVRVVANVNGTEFTYPSKGGIEWLEVGPAMSAQ